ncbi:DUF6153 family protein [Amycolatopsis vancoresmycina]|uniref:DUF2946 domain-containing protein n=1 Tax=Amycolatopsis vancoresmycina DSM 44592 TaxID=1292037 RepID=R1G6I5_9PSEU|nr:DUF6153 family protein [Amycolatopsis vancoresmycina]EOD67033.1 hypothetical protein H480_18461 [Amycolatopsis vancoresmycina DSM 44592]
MATPRLGKAQRVLLLCALALCVVAMHHVSAAMNHQGSAAMPVMQTAQAELTADSGEQHPGMPDGVHNLLHLCLAIISAVVALFLALTALAWSRPSAVAAPASPRGSPHPGRPPDRRGRAILTSLCVLRT